MNNLKIYDFLHKILTFAYIPFIKLLRKKAKFVGPAFIKEKYKNSDTVFIMAAGISINSYTQKDFGFIRKFDSIGVNNFIIHDFEPTLYFLETQPRDFNYFNMLRDLNKESSKIPFLYKDFASLNKIKFKNLLDNIEDIPDTVENFFFAKDGYVKGNWEESKKYFLKNCDKNDYLYNYRSSLEYSILLAYKCGYKNVVLCGFDMSDRYFYCENNKYISIAKKYNLCNYERINTIHNDDDRKNKIIDFLVDMNYELKTKRDGGVFVFSSDMSLAEDLPVFERNI